MKQSKQLLLLFIVTFFVQCLSAQTRTITGSIKDKKGQALEGAVIKNKNSGATSLSTKEGNFSILAGNNDMLVISSVGYQSTNIKVTGNTMAIVLADEEIDLQEVVLLGSRKGGRVKTESPVPVDVININQAGVPTAKMDLTSVLNYAAPSFNYNKQTGADGADHIDLGTLRGLGPDQTLVLINGKRRHQTAFVALFGTKGRGNSGVDLNAFPQSAVDRIEILRDGASAQYGSDAIAGVINLILKKDVDHWSFNTGWSGYYDSKFNAYNTRATNRYIYSNPIDGGTFSFSANNGAKIGKKGGFINVSFDFLNQSKTFRQVADTNVATNPNALPINSGRRAFGDGSVTTAGAMYNMEIPTNATTTFYSFGGYNYKKSDAYAYSRNWSARPDRFPITSSGNRITVPSIMQTDIDGETYFNPHIQTVIQDISFAAGIRGVTKNNWNWDVSNTLGRNDFHYFGDKTFNATNIGKSTPTHFDDGGFNFLQNTLNLDFNKSFKSVAEGLNIGWGTEFRYERYGIYKGEEASYIAYPNTFGFNQAPGSQGFPGFSPSDVVSANRTNLSAYVDAELNATKAWLFDAAVRLENYSDFGFVNTYKLASRYKVSGNFNLRGSISTGFRAPSLQQINFSNTLTSFSGGQLVQSRIASNNDAVTKSAGIPNLKQETSTNASIGFSWKPAKGLTVTVDGYSVKVKDRVVLSGLFSASDNSLPKTFTDQLNALGVATAQFFSNAVNTTNTGIDIVADYNKKWGNKSFKILLAGNIQKMSVDAVHVPAKLNDSYLHQKTFFSDREETFLLASAPTSKLTLNLEYTVDKIGLGVHLTYFGSLESKGFGWTGLASKAGTNGPGDPAISGSFGGIDPYVDIDGYSDQVHVAPEVFKYSGKITTDIFASYKISKTASFFIGADNLFNVHPDFAAVKNARYESFDNESGGPWESVQMGFNGLRLFSKLVLNF